MSRYDKDYIHNKKNGGTIYCYGNIEEDSNFYVVCDNEYFDGVACDVDAIKLNTWKKVCEYLIKNYRHDIEEISTC
jgi:hypothetical protein